MIKIPVLAYQRICSMVERTDDDVVRERTLRRHLSHLSTHGYRTPALTTALTTDVPLKRSVLLTFDDVSYDTYSIALPLLLEHGLRATVFVAPEAKRGRPLQPKHLRAMASAGIEIGSHGSTYRRLDEVDDTTALHELLDSKAMLEDALGEEVRWFAYPYGAVTTHLKELVRACGYSAGFCATAGTFDGHDDVLEVRRVLAGDCLDVPALVSKLDDVEKATRGTSSLWTRWFSPSAAATAS